MSSSVARALTWCHHSLKNERTLIALLVGVFCAGQEAVIAGETIRKNAQDGRAVPVVFKPAGEEFSAILPQAPQEYVEPGRETRVWKCQTGPSVLSINSRAIYLNNKPANAVTKDELLKNAVQSFLDQGWLQCEAAGLTFRVSTEL